MTSPGVQWLHVFSVTSICTRACADRPLNTHQSALQLLQRLARNLKSHSRGLVSWQAAVFSSFLLLPREVLIVSVVTAQRRIALTRRLGSLWIDDQTCSVAAARYTVSDIQSRHRVSQQTAVERLLAVGALHVDSASRLERRSLAMKEMSIRTAIWGVLDDVENRASNAA
jgi:hypothetical protein